LASLILRTVVLGSSSRGTFVSAFSSIISAALWIEVANHARCSGSFHFLMMWAAIPAAKSSLVPLYRMARSTNEVPRAKECSSDRSLVRSLRIAAGEAGTSPAITRSTSSSGTEGADGSRTAPAGKCETISLLGSHDLVRGPVELRQSRQMPPAVR